MAAPPIPHHVDVQVGRAVRRHRKAAGWSQQQLASAIGVTFQQLQKYERAANRISASKLHEIAQALGMRAADFYRSEGEAADQSPPLNAVDTLLACSIQKLSPESRRAVLVVVNAMLAPAAG